MSVGRETAQRSLRSLRVRLRATPPAVPPPGADEPVIPPQRESMAPYYAYLAAERLVHMLPLRTSYWLGYRVADTLLLAAPRNLDPLRDNLRHVLPGVSERALRRVVRRNVRNLTHCWVDVMAMSSRRTNLWSRIDVESFENFDRARKSGRGVVVASMHFGSWEVGLAGWNAIGGRMALLAEVLRPRRLFERVIGARGRQNVQVIPIDVAAMRAADPHAARRIGAASMREVFKVLRSGGVIAMALDRDLIGNGELVPFFDAPAPIPVGVVDIAMRTNAAVVPAILFRNDRRVRAVTYPEVPYDSSAPRDQEVRRVTREVLSLFERAIRSHPDQWHVLEPIWPARRRP